MAVIFDPKKKKDENEQNPQFGAPSAVAPSAPQTPTPRGSSSGRFSNIQNYIRANRQAGQNLAQNIGGQLEQKGEGIRQELRQAQQQFQQQAEKGRLDRTKIMPEAQQIIGRAGQPGFETDAERFQRISSGQYIGPQGLQHVTTLQARGQEVESQGRNLGTSAGRTQVLGQLYGGQGGYSAGQRRLDDLLIGTNTNALQRARGLASGLGRTVQQQERAAEGLAGYFGQEARQVGSEVAKQLADAAQADEAALAAKQQKTFEEEQKNIEALKKQRDALAFGAVPKDLIDRLGLQYLVNQNFDARGQALAEGFEGAAYNPIREAQNLSGNVILTYGLNPAQMFKIREATGFLTRENIASKEEAARLNALARLAGRGPVIDESKAGTFQGSSIELDPEFLKRREQEAEIIRNQIAEARAEGERMRGIGDIGARNAGRFYSLTDAIARKLRSRLKVV